MGTRFRKSKEILPGVKVNVGKKSVGISVGGKLGGVSVNTKGDVTKRVSAPGTGLSYVERENVKGRKDAKPKKASFCGQCGARVNEGSKFCGRCGARTS